MYAIAVKLALIQTVVFKYKVLILTPSVTIKKIA